MPNKPAVVAVIMFLFWAIAAVAPAATRNAPINARSAMLVDLTDGQVLYSQNPDSPIAPASITKVLTLYLVQEAIQDGRLHPWDRVTVSARAAATGGSRMGLRRGDIVPVSELIKGMAVVSGNDACVAMAEHMAGNVEDFVRRMNQKARALGMNASSFQTPNGLPAKGQYTTARDIATLSMAYLRRFPDSLSIHSMQSYTYKTATHRNANRLLGRCEGVDGLKTGFVCASGYNLTATAIRNDRRLVAVVMGAPSPGVRATETERLLNAGYHSLNTGTSTAYALQHAVPKAAAGQVQTASKRTPKNNKTANHLAGKKKFRSENTVARADGGTPSKKASKATKAKQQEPVLTQTASAKAGKSTTRQAKAPKASAPTVDTGKTKAKSGKEATRVAKAAPAKAAPSGKASAKSADKKSATRKSGPTARSKSGGAETASDATQGTKKLSQNTHAQASGKKASTN